MQPLGTVPPLTLFDKDLAFIYPYAPQFLGKNQE